MNLRFAAVALFVMGTLVAVVPLPRAWAHAHMVKSSPTDHASLTQSPAVIRAWFSEELTGQGSALRLYDVNQKLLAQGGLDPSDSSHEVMKLVPPHLRAGSYMVTWHSVSSNDQAVTQGYFGFSIGTAMQKPATLGASTQMGAMPGMAAMPPSGAHAGPLPSLLLLAPANHARLHNPVSVMIETPSDISLVTMGPKMTTGPGVHLHIVVDGVVTMPASDQLVASGTHRYTYELSPLKAGTHTIEVYWADNQTHAPVGGTQTATIVVF